jgi:hypothetical protein
MIVSLRRGTSASLRFLTTVMLVLGVIPPGGAGLEWRDLLAFESRGQPVGRVSKVVRDAEQFVNQLPLLSGYLLLGC